MPTKLVRNARNAESAHNSRRSKPSRFEHLQWGAINKNTSKRNNLVNVVGNSDGTIGLNTQVSSRYVQLTSFVDNTTAFVRDSDSIVEWTQPANTVITGIRLFFPSTTYSTGAGNNLGYEVGTSSSGAEIVATIADEIIDAGQDGTDIATGALMTLALTANPTQNDITIATNHHYSGTSSRTIYLNTICDNTAAVTTPGTVRWIIDYLQVA